MAIRRESAGLEFLEVAVMQESKDGLEEQHDEHQDTNDWVVGVDLVLSAL